MIKTVRKYCTGCGLCHSVLGTSFNTDERGYFHPIIDKYDDFYGMVCPSMGKSLSLSSGEVWGKSRKVWLGWAADDSVRKIASSGGILTALSCHLLETGFVDGIIHTSVDPQNPSSTITIVSCNENDVKNAYGSRYSISHPLFNIKEIIDSNKKYAFIGKPCDVSALKRYLDIDKSLSQNIIVLLSFFCAGIPSIQANEKLLNKLGATADNPCVSLRYRGNGWPGFAHAVLKNGEEHELSYQESWRTILGRDIAPICRFCADGIGECADITCGDAWYISDDGKPIVEESDGRNVIFARSRLGEEICKKAYESGKIELSDYSNYTVELKQSQAFQYDRRASMKYMILGLKLMGQVSPLYNSKVLNKLGKNVPPKIKFKRFGGTVKRIIKGKI